MTPFAAGCAICGTDIAALRAARTEHASGLGVAQRLPRLPRLGDDGLRIVIALLVTIAAPFIGLLLACWFAWQLDEEGNTRTRNVMLAIAALGVVSMMQPLWVWRLLHGA